MTLCIQRSMTYQASGGSWPLFRKVKNNKNFLYQCYSCHYYHNTRVMLRQLYNYIMIAWKIGPPNSYTYIYHIIMYIFMLNQGNFGPYVCLMLGEWPVMHTCHCITIVLFQSWACSYMVYNMNMYTCMDLCMLIIWCWLPLATILCWNCWNTSIFHASIPLASTAFQIDLELIKNWRRYGLSIEEG